MRFLGFSLPKCNSERDTERIPDIVQALPKYNAECKRSQDLSHKNLIEQNQYRTRTEHEAIGVGEMDSRTH